MTNGEPRTLEALREAIRQPDEKARLRAIRKIGGLGDRAGAEILLWVLEDEERRCSKAWRRILQEASSTEVQFRLYDPHQGRLRSMTAAVATALAELGATEALSTLLEDSHDFEDPDVQEAVERLAASDPEPLIAYLGGERPDPSRVAGTLEILGNTADARAVPLLQQWLRKGDYAATALKALERVLGRDAAGAATADLRRLSEIDGVQQKRIDQTYAGDFPRYVSEDLDCDWLRRLARDELARRGEA